MRKRGLCWGLVFVRLSIRLSVTMVHCIHTAEYIVKLLSLSSIPIILVFDSMRRCPIPKETPFSGDAKWVGKCFAYLGKTV